jgi:superfamily II RNA helicase
LELKKEVRHVTQSIRYKHLLNAYKNYLKPGRLFLHKNNNIYIIFNIYEDHGKFICAAHNIKRLPRTRKSRFRLKKVDLNQIKGIYSYRADLPEDYSPERLKRIIHNIVEEDLQLLNIEVPAKDAVGGEELSEINRRLDALPCETCVYTKTCHKKKKAPLIKLLRDLQSLGMQMEGIGGGLWLSFKRHMRFLRETGFVDEGDILTPDGYWASKLRLDQPLLIAEAIREGAFDGVSSQILAGGLAPFVWDRTLEVELRVAGTLNLSELEERFNSILEHIGGIRDLKSKRGFDSPPLLFWPAAALFMWAKNVPWEQLLTYVPVDEGDMASLIMRTADHLRQIANLHETHPQLAAVAEHAIELILREPVYIQ